MKQNTITEETLIDVERFIRSKKELKFLFETPEFSHGFVLLVFGLLRKAYEEIKNWKCLGILEMRSHDVEDGLANNWFPVQKDSKLIVEEYNINSFRKKREDKQDIKPASYYKQELETTKKVLNDRLIERDKTILEQSIRIKDLTRDIKSMVKPREVDLDISL